MTNQDQALLEAMEQQSVSVAKSSIVCNLPARTAVLAAANPIGGHYNKAKTVSENLKMNPALLSRFNLVFILIDRPNEEWDGMLSDHIMKLHRFGSKNNANQNESLQSSIALSSPLTSRSDEPLRERLRKKPQERIVPIPHDAFRKYIAYARQYVFPTLTKDACDVLQEFYLELRRLHHCSDGAPITLRQLESLVRLTEARAKLELREEATRQDALDVVEIMQSSMADTLADPSGGLDVSRSANGSGMSSRGVARKFINALQRHANVMSKSLFTIDEMKQILHNCRATVKNFFDFLTSLNTQGFIIKRSSKTYQLLTVDY